MDLILLRHAEKEPFGNDPFLSPRGQEQARRLPSELDASLLGPDTTLIASPKKRAIETLQPLAQASSAKLRILDDLDERRFHESYEGFTARVRRIVASLDETPPTGVTVFCSHLDWIEEFRMALPCTEDLTRAPYDHWPSLQSLHLRRASRDEPWVVIQFGRNS